MNQVPIVMPQMGQSVAEGTVIRWLKKVGEEIQADEILLEVETDKANVEIESPASGKLVSCLKQEGEIAAAGETIGLIESLEVAPALQPLPAATPSAAKPHAGAGDEAVLVSAHSASLMGGDLPEIDRNQFSPFVLRLAMLNNVSFQDLQNVKGTGRGGRVTKYDLLEFLARRPVGPASVPALTGKAELSEEDLSSLGEVVPMTSIRKTIADHVVQSIHTSAHVTMVHAVDVTHIVNLRERIKDAFEKQYGAKMTYSAVMFFVTARVLKDFPKINAAIYGTNIILRKDINIGCAVALADETLVVPVVRHTDRKSFPEITQDLARLIGLARRKELKRAEVEGGTFTISNFGSFGSIIGTPIINQPQVAILGMGAIHKAPVVADGQVCIRDQLFLSFTFDHRIIDGEQGGRFLNAIQRATEALTEETLTLTHI
ncbi:MAG: 2-oxo acid dehydrogenase subunit E2 [Kiritimatiellae bacterium]|nr:2-oxo acid dehydrogenase subunit E2 [Kiritimatiellia bacterium]